MVIADRLDNGEQIPSQQKKEKALLFLQKGFNFLRNVTETRRFLAQIELVDQFQAAHALRDSKLWSWWMLQR